MVGEQRKLAQLPVTVGGVVVGGKQLVGSDGATQLKPPRDYRGSVGNGGAGKDTIVEVIALGNADEDGAILLTPEELANLDIDPKLVEQLKKEIEKMAGDRGWTLEVVDEEGEPARQIRGIIDDSPGEGEGRGEKGQGEGGDRGDGQDYYDDEGEGEGSGSEERFFKEEL